MATIEQNLTQLVQDRDDLVTNLTTKGITGLTGDETFTELVPEVLNISGGGSGHDWSAIGYSGEPQVIQDGYDYAVQVKNNWNPNLTNYNSKFSRDMKLIFMPFVNLSNATSAISMFFYCNSLTTIPQLDTSNIKSFYYFFRDCTSLVTIPQLDTSSGTNFQEMFNNCISLTTIPQLNTSNGTDFSSMFNNCTSLVTIPQLDTSNGTNFSSMFSANNSVSPSLSAIPKLNMSKATQISNLIYNGSVHYTNLTTMGGFENLGQAYLTTRSANYYTYKLDLSKCTALTHDSLMNVINNLYDIATAGVQTQQLVLGSTNLAKLSADEIAIATNKGWTVS